MKRKLIVLTFILVAIIVIALICVSNYHQDRKIEKLKGEGDKLIEQVENYKKRTHKIPQFMEDMHLNLPDDYPINYNVQKDSINYTISFQIRPFKSMVYNSDTKLWISQ